MSIVPRLTDPDHEATDILALWRRNFEKVPEDRHEWLYRATPEQPSLYMGLWTDEGRLVGGAGIIPRRMSSSNGVCVAGQAVDLVVDRAYRSAGPAIKLHREAMDQAEHAGMNLLYGFPIPTSEAVLRRLGYKVLGIYGRWVKPLRHHYLLKRRMPGWLATPAAFLLDLTARLMAKDTWSRLPKGWGSRLMSAPDERFDTFWQRMAPQLTLAGWRDSAFLEWRFFRQPGQHRQLFTVSDEIGQLKAYLVFQESGNGFLQILDFLAEDGRKLGILLSEFSQYARTRKARSLTAGFLGDEETKAVLRRAGFVPRDNKDAKVLVYTSDETLQDPNRWYLTDADRDT